MEIETIILENSNQLTITENMVNLYNQCNGKKHITNKIKSQVKFYDDEMKNIIKLSEQLDSVIEKLLTKRQQIESENMKLKAESLKRIKFNK